jgi:hypothetical protein
MPSRARFDLVCFAEAGRGRPIEHARCECGYAEGYVGVDGRAIRPIPGEEALDRAALEQLSKDLGLPAEPPPG